MKSPQSRQHKEKKGAWVKYGKKNPFYDSKAWKGTCAAYDRLYRNELYVNIPQGKWRGQGMKMEQVSYILSLDFLPCEICLKLYVAEAYKKVVRGIDHDHIIPINQPNALVSEGYGDPFEFNNLQLLCKRHHAKKSQRER